MALAFLALSMGFTPIYFVLVRYINRFTFDQIDKLKK